MEKHEFLNQLREKLKGLPEDEIDERMEFYSEMIDDRVEEGKSEARAVAELGDLDEIKDQILSEIPMGKLVKERIKPKHRMKAWEIILIILGSPLWIAILLGIFAVFIALFAALFSTLIAMWVVTLGFLAAAVCGIVEFVFCFMKGMPLLGFIFLGMGIFGIGLMIIFFIGCKELTKSIGRGIKALFLGIKSKLVRKEEKENENN